MLEWSTQFLLPRTSRQAVLQAAAFAMSVQIESILRPAMNIGHAYGLAIGDEQTREILARV